MPSLVDLGGGGGNPAKKKQLLPAGPTVAPKIGGNYSQAAVQRAVAKNSAPAPIRRVAATSRPSPAPKPPPVVVSNNQGNYTRPKPPPPVNPGPITGGGGGPRGNNNTPKPGSRKAPIVTVPKEPRLPTPPPAAAPITPAAQAPPVTPPDLDAYLAGDETYGSIVNQYNTDWATLQAQTEAARGQNSTSFAQRFRDLQTAQTGDESNLLEDFGSRGLAHSGSYADALSTLQGQYGQSTTNLQSEQSQAEADLVAQLTNFQSQQQQAIEQARADAVARRAAQYGLA